MMVLVLPAFNEAANLGALLTRVEEIRPLLFDDLLVLVVDDGSTDDTAAVARAFSGRLPVEVVAHPANRGLAAAIKTGLAAALKRAHGLNDVIVSMDADDTHPPGLFPLMLAHIREGYDLVIASRFVEGARVRGLAPSRQLFSWGASLLFRTLAPMQGVRDYTCGYRAYRASLLAAVWDSYGEDITTESGFSCMADILLKCRERAPIAVEVPFVLRYDQKRGASKMRVGSTVRDSFRLLARSVLRDVRRRLTGCSNCAGRSSCEVLRGGPR